MQLFCKPYGTISEIPFSTEKPTQVNVKVNCAEKQTMPQKATVKGHT